MAGMNSVLFGCVLSISNCVRFLLERRVFCCVLSIELPSLLTLCEPTVGPTSEPLNTGSTGGVLTIVSLSLLPYDTLSERPFSVHRSVSGNRRNHRHLDSHVLRTPNGGR